MPCRHGDPVLQMRRRLSWTTMTMTTMTRQQPVMRVARRSRATGASLQLAAAVAAAPWSGQVGHLPKSTWHQRQQREEESGPSAAFTAQCGSCPPPQRLVLSPTAPGSPCRPAGHGWAPAGRNPGGHRAAAAQHQADVGRQVLQGVRVGVWQSGEWSCNMCACAGDTAGVGMCCSCQTCGSPSFPSSCP